MLFTQKIVDLIRICDHTLSLWSGSVFEQTFCLITEIDYFAVVVAEGAGGVETGRRRCID